MVRCFRVFCKFPKYSFIWYMNNLIILYYFGTSCKYIYVDGCIQSEKRLGIAWSCVSKMISIALYFPAKLNLFLSHRKKHWHLSMYSFIYKNWCESVASPAGNIFLPVPYIINDLFSLMGYCRLRELWNRFISGMRFTQSRLYILLIIISVMPVCLNSVCCTQWRLDCPIFSY